MHNYKKGDKLPDPNELPNSDWQDVTHPMQAQNTNSREYYNAKTDTRIRFDPATPGAPGFEGQDHYHIYNPNSTGKGDYYLDIDGNPVPKGSSASHILISLVRMLFGDDE